MMRAVQADVNGCRKGGTPGPEGWLHRWSQLWWCLRTCPWEGTHTFTDFLKKCYIFH